MIRSIHIRRIMGVDINLDLSLILVVVLAWFYWGHNGSLLAFIYGLVLVILAFLSVLAHEMGHAIAAREFGARVLDVTLSPLAGVARIEQSSTTPRDEILIAVSGPAVNLAIVMLLLPWTFLVAVILGPATLFSVGDRFQHLGPGSLLAAVVTLNLGLMIFNLLPAFPLDGGRIVRASLIASLGRRRATVVASRIGYGIAALFVLYGLVSGDLLFPLLGLFILWAGYHENRVSRIEEQLQSLTVGSYALWDGGGISPEIPLSFVTGDHPHDRVVTQRGRVVGMLWTEDLLTNLYGGLADRQVSTFMEDPRYVADVAESLWDVEQQMRRERTRAIPVIEKGLYRGIFYQGRLDNIYRQIRPGLRDRDWEMDEEWREAVLHVFRWPGRDKR